MTTPHTMRRADQPITLGPRHGYAIDGDHAMIHAELEIPPYHPGGEWGLELWATEEPYREGALTGTRVAEVALELPTPIGPYVHRVDTRVDALLPLQGRAYSMVLALIDRGESGTSSVHALAHYPERQTFTAPHLQGTVGYRIRGDEVVLEAAAVFNPRDRGNVSGTLSLELWGYPQAGGSTEGLRLAAVELGCVSGQAALPAIERRAAFTQPPVGAFELALLLREWTVAHGYVTRDRRDFASIYESVAKVAEVAEVAKVAEEETTDKLRLLPGGEAEAPSRSKTKVETETRIETETKIRPQTKTPAKPAEVVAEVVAPVVAPVATVGLVSIQTATVEALAAVKGLNLKLAKEIVKARPFASLADLVRVRGIGEKTLVRLRHLLTL